MSISCSLRRRNATTALGQYQGRQSDGGHCEPGTTGNDTIIAGDGGDTLYGDPFDVIPLSTGRGGNDILSATGTTISSLVTPT